jgi:hypothetical protein
MCIRGRSELGPRDTFSSAGTASDLDFTPFTTPIFSSRII